jgi:quercetin dioxygenase-like cupin family protein
MRRVITGVNSTGKAVFTRDDQSPHFIAMGNLEMGELWFDPQPVISDGTGDPAEGKLSVLPKIGEALVRYVVFPIKAEMDALMTAAKSGAQTEQRQGDFETEQDNPGMHTTETIDYGFVLEGSIALELDDGVKKTLHAGDCFVQNGTRHAWHNETDQRAIIAVVMVGAQR